MTSFSVSIIKTKVKGGSFFFKRFPELDSSVMTTWGLGWFKRTLLGEYVVWGLLGKFEWRRNFQSFFHSALFKKFWYLPINQKKDIQTLCPHITSASRTKSSIVFPTHIKSKNQVSQDIHIYDLTSVTFQPTHP